MHGSSAFKLEAQFSIEVAVLKLLNKEGKRIKKTFLKGEKTSAAAISYSWLGALLCSAFSNSDSNTKLGFCLVRCTLLRLGPSVVWALNQNFEEKIESVYVIDFYNSIFLLKKMTRGRCLYLIIIIPFSSLFSPLALPLWLTPYITNSGQWMVLIDAAKGAATKPPDLSQYPADFVVISFYKVLVYALCDLTLVCYLQWIWFTFFIFVFLFWW